MLALTTLLPVFFMLALGFLSRKRGWISPDQKAGANALVFTILFPIMIFNLVAGADIQLETLSVLVYVFLAFILAIWLGQLTVGFTGRDKGHFTPFLMPTVEGGAVVLPLYVSIVGISSNTVIFDLAGSAIAFVVLPILVARRTAKATSTGEMITSVLLHPFVLAVSLGLLMNFTGLYGWIQESAFAALYQGIMANATGPILGTILFVLGYDFTIDPKTLAPMLRLMFLRLGYYALIVAGFFLLFPGLMAEPDYKIAVLLYFMCPTGFAIPSLIQDLFQSEEDMTFSSTFISLQMVPTLIAYSLIVVFMV